jgi:hypothetical protein
MLKILLRPTVLYGTVYATNSTLAVWSVAVEEFYVCLKQLVGISTNSTLRDQFFHINNFENDSTVLQSVTLISDWIPPKC